MLSQRSRDDAATGPAALVYANGTVLERCEYDAYGKVTVRDTRYAIRDTNLYGNPYLFTGRRLDILDNSSLKIQYNRNRYYDYYTGRWLTQDPLGINPAGGTHNPLQVTGQYKEGVNLYEYVGSNPSLSIDPFGAMSKDECENNLSNWEMKNFDLYAEVATKRDFWGMCLRDIKCKKCCKGNTQGSYNTWSRMITLCANNLDNFDEGKKVLRHELFHALSLCGKSPSGCKACMIEEKRAYFWSRLCVQDEDCTQRAWDSCISGGWFARCNKKKSYRKYIGVGWPPDKVDGIGSPNDERVQPW